jgi:hypothetical protein
MFGFFRSNPDRATHRISPDYWSEKLTSNRAAAKTYSREALEQYVAEHLESAQERWPGVTDAWNAHVPESHYFNDYEDSARQALNDFEHTIKGRKETFRFTDTWEADFKDFDWWCLGSATPS